MGGHLADGWVGGSGSIGVDHGIGNISTLRSVMLNNLDGLTLNLDLMTKWPMLEFLILHK